MISLCQCTDTLQLKAHPLLTSMFQPLSLICSTNCVDTGKSDQFMDLTEQPLEEV